MASLLYHPFPQTHWSLVRRAGFAEGQLRHEALTTLLTRYEPAMLSYLRHVRHIPEEEAKDLLQAFIADKILEYELLKHAQEGRGRFRTFLLSSLNRFAIDRFRSRERNPANHAEYLDKASAKQASPPASVIVEATWARRLIQSVLDRMRHECEEMNRRDVWAVFEKRVLIELFERRKPVPYEELARELRVGSPTQAANLLVTAKRMYARLLRAAVAEYEVDDQAIDAEISELCKALEVSEIE